MTTSVSRLPLSLDPLIAEAKRRMRKRRLLVAVLAALIAGGAVGAALALTSANSVRAVGSECGSGVSGPSFRVFACESGGAAARHPHPKELLVLRSDGSAVSYPRYGGTDFGVGGGEVVASYDLKLVRVTSSRLVPLLTKVELAKALHRPAAAIMVMGIYKLRVDAHRDVYFVASVLSRGRRGCRNPLLERTAGGAVRQIRSSTSHDGICR